jgi:hypothetical protein
MPIHLARRTAVNHPERVLLTPAVNIPLSRRNGERYDQVNRTADSRDRELIDTRKLRAWIYDYDVEADPDLARPASQNYQAPAEFGFSYLGTLSHELFKPLSVTFDFSAMAAFIAAGQ